MWTKILSVITGPIVGFFERRQERKQEEHRMEMKLKTARATAAHERILQGQQGNINWELQSIKAAGWRPDYLTVLTTVVLALTFVPHTQPYVINGFESLQATPIWFQIAVLMVYSSAFGIRIFDEFKKVIQYGK